MIHLGGLSFRCNLFQKWFLIFRHNTVCHVKMILFLSSVQFFLQNMFTYKHHTIFFIDSSFFKDFMEYLCNDDSYYTGLAINLTDFRLTFTSRECRKSLITFLVCLSSLSVRLLG